MPRRGIHVVFSAIALVIAAAVPAFAADAPAGTPFTVKLPAGFADFATQSQSTKSGDGTIVTTNWISKAPTGEAVVVTVSKMPGKILDPAKLIHGTRDSLLKSLKATLESEEQVPGTSATRLLFNNGSAFLRARLYVENDTLYQLLYVGPNADARNGAHVAALFDSFQLAAAAASDSASAQTAAAAVPKP